MEDGTAGTNGDARRAPEPERSAHPVQSRLRARIRSLEDALSRIETEGGAGAFHDLRVAARRVAEFLRTWAALIPDRCFRRALKDVRELRRRAGRARDLEAGLGLLRERLSRHGAPDDDALRLLGILETRLDRRRLRAASRVRSRKGRRVMARLDEAERCMNRDLLSHLQAFEAAHAHVEERRQAALEAVAASLESANDARLHGARIAIRKWRYAAGSLGANRAGAITPGSLRELQEVMGSILDGAALRDMLAEHIGARSERTATLPAIVAGLDADRPALLERCRALGDPLVRSGVRRPVLTSRA
jgi:CHAD domain-containing protein